VGFLQGLGGETGSCCGRRSRRPRRSVASRGTRWITSLLIWPCGCYTSVRQRYDGNRAALSQARRIVRQAVHILTDLSDDAFTITRQPSTSTVVTR
jgi:hypothetical protein